MNILLAGTGSVAAIKYWRLMTALQKLGEVKGVLTDKGEFFARKALTQDVVDSNLLSSLVTERDEWEWDKIGDPVHHIDLKDWADVLVIAPLTANTLTKMAVGIVDNLLTSLYYAWPKDKNIVVAPAMNTDMWNNPLTQEHLRILSLKHTYTRKPYQHSDFRKSEDYCVSGSGYINFDKKHYSSIDETITFGNLIVYRRLGIVEPVESKLACGVVGKGAMAPLADIVSAVEMYGK